MMATLFFHECPLIVMVTLGRLPPSSASTTSWETFEPAHGLRRLDVGSKLDVLLLPSCVRSLQVQSSALIGHISPVGIRHTSDRREPADVTRKAPGDLDR